MKATPFFTQHSPFLVVLLLFLILATAYAGLIPLGEAPDEPAHLTYARFIAKNGRLPATLEERAEAGYRSTWPPLYHYLAAIPLAIVGDTPPTRLKSVGDTPRRLIPTNGQTIAAFIHTEDEAWPWQGITLAWHLGRFVSVVLSALTVCVTYAIIWNLTHHRLLATSVAALQAFWPQFLFVSSSINDDSLLFLLSGLVLLIVFYYTKRIEQPGFFHFLLLGTLLGLATVSKYNALPLWAIVFIWTFWLTFIHTYPNAPRRSYPLAVQALSRLAALLTGAVLTSGWWFFFIWRSFNQIDTLGPIQGSFAALSAGTADASLRRLSAGGATFTIPTPSQWTEWTTLLFQSFWGLFGGGSTIQLPGWLYWFLAIITVTAIASLVISRISGQSFIIHPLRGKASSFTIQIPLLVLLLPLFFLPLPIMRFTLSNRLVETAQGRHLFPALPIIALALVLGTLYLTQYATRNTRYAKLTMIILPATIFLLSLYSLYLIISSYPSRIPLRTTIPENIQHSTQIKLTEDVTLVGYEIRGTPKGSALPVALYWQANAFPAEDYLINLTLTDPSGAPIGNWVGHPVGGRYPTRAWDEGDIVRDVIDVPFLRTAPITNPTLSLTLLDTSGMPVTEPVKLFTLPYLPYFQSLYPDFPSGLRTDNLPVNAPFTYRSTLSFALPGQTTPPELIAPNGQTFTPDFLLNAADGIIAHFIVAPNWPSGDYQLTMSDEQLTISNRQIQFEPPPVQHTTNANFAEQVTLLGYDLPQRRVQPGESFPLTLHLRAERTLGKDFIIFNHLLDQNATQRGGADRVPQQYYTTLLWVPGEIVSDAYEVPVDANAPPGVYWLDIGLYPADDPTFSLPLFVDGQPVDRHSVSIGPIKVGGPPEGATSKLVQPQTSLNANFGSEIVLLGFDAGGDSSTFTLFWHAETFPSADYTVFIHVLDSQGNVVAQADSPPATGAYPTSLWDSGEIIVDKRTLPNLPPGSYAVRAGLYRPDTGERLPVDGSLDGAVNLFEFEVKE